MLSLWAIVGRLFRTASKKLGIIMKVHADDLGLHIVLNLLPKRSRSQSSSERAESHTKKQPWNPGLVLVSTLTI